MMQHTSGQKSVFTKSHDPNNVSIAKKAEPSLDPGFTFRIINKDSSHSTRRPRKGVVRTELGTSVAPRIAGGRDA